MKCIIVLALAFASITVAQIRPVPADPKPVASQGQRVPSTGASGAYRPIAQLPSGVAPKTAGPRQSMPAMKFFGLDFGPYTDGQNPTVNPAIGAATLTARLQLVAQYTNWIRTYSSTNGLEDVPQIAKSMDLKVAAEAYISSNLAQSSQEIANLIANGQQGLVDVAIVGNEALLYNYVTASTLIGYIQQVQQALPGIPVATADTWNTLVANPAVVAAGSIVLPEIYPYWEGAAIENALAQTISEYRRVTAVAGGLPVWIAEAGWPASGGSEGAAVPSAANQGYYALNFVNWATEAGVSYFFFEGLDEPWKGSAGEEGPQGASWGVLADTGTVKPWMQPVLGSNGLTCGTSTPAIAFTFIPPFGDPVTNLEGTASE